jgi:hypothetical protein
MWSRQNWGWAFGCLDPSSLVVSKATSFFLLLRLTFDCALSRGISGPDCLYFREYVPITLAGQFPWRALDRAQRTSFAQRSPKEQPIQDRQFLRRFVPSCSKRNHTLIKDSVKDIHGDNCPLYQST